MTLTQQEIITLAWESGYDYAVQRIREAADDVLAVKPPAVRTREERIADDLARMEALAVTHHLGGPVAPW